MTIDPHRAARTKHKWLQRFSHLWTAKPRNQKQLRDVLRDAKQHNLLDEQALSMIEGALQVADMRVRDIMIPRGQMVIVEEDRPPEEFVATVIESGHSRFPVIGDSRDEIVGILLAKDLLAHFSQRGNDRFSMRDVLRPPEFIPESKRLNDLLSDFRAKRNHMAIVVDEYGGVAGLVTIEDVLEQIVGDIGDEHDIDEDEDIKRHSESEYTVKAMTSIRDFNAYFGTHFGGEEFETIGGIVVKAFGYVPERNERKSVDGMHFRILRADQRRVYLLRVTRRDDSSSLEHDLRDNAGKPG